MDHRQLLPNLHGNISSSPGSVSEALLSRTGYTILAVIIGVFSVAGVCMNVLVIVVTVRHRKLRQPLNYALVNLAVADLGCALFGGLPTMVTNAMGYFSMGRLGCVLEGFAVAFFGELPSRTTLETEDTCTMYPLGIHCTSSCICFHPNKLN